MNTLSIIVLLLAFSVSSVILFRRFNLPPVLGYLLVGVLIGPHAYDLIDKVDTVSHPAEFGVLFLMFSIGLEFSLAKLYSMRRIVFGLGLAQVVISIVVAALISMAFDLSWQAGIALGCAVSMSSTAVLIKLLADRMELDSKHGREVFGVLLFQDLAVVPLLILIPALSGSPGQLATQMGLAFVKAAVILGLVFFGGQKIMHYWFHVVARNKSAELFMLNILLITLGLAWLTQVSGLSAALGAFLAGMLISETQYRLQVEEAIKSFRDVLMGLFFITIGMLLDMHLVVSNLFAVAGVLTGLLVIKFIMVAGLSRLFGSMPGTAIRSALWLCAGGEFGFVLISIIRTEQLVPPAVLQTVLAALVLSLLIAPFIIHFSDRIVLSLVSNEWMLRSMQITQSASHFMTMEKHALICGFGRTGQYVARFMAHEGTPYLALDLDPDRVREASMAGENVIYGSAAMRENLINAGVSRASVVIISFVDISTTEQILMHVRELAPSVPVIVKTQEERDLRRLYRAGAAEAVPEILESAMMLASYALIHLGVPINRVFRRIRQIRSERYQTLRGVFRGESSSDHFDIDEPRLHSITLSDGTYAIGKTLGELMLSEFGVQVNAVRRRQILAHAPSEDTCFEEGDVIVIMGIPSALSLAEDRILKG